jgi:hypothetical protein
VSRVEEEEEEEVVVVVDPAAAAAAATATDMAGPVAAMVSMRRPVRDEQRHRPERKHLAAPSPREDFVLGLRRQRQLQERASEDVGARLGWLEPQQADRVRMPECGILKRRTRLFKEDHGRLWGGLGGNHVWVLLAQRQSAAETTGYHVVFGEGRTALLQRQQKEDAERRVVRAQYISGML